MTTLRPNNVDRPRENANFLPLFAALVLLTPAARAQTRSDAVNLNSSSGAAVNWNTNPAHWERVIQQRTNAPALRLGKSDWQANGPLIEGLRRRRSTENRSLGKRLVSLPIVRLFVPGPMPSPPGGGRYLLWGESDRPWITVAQGAPAGDPAVTHEAQSLISFGR